MQLARNVDCIVNLDPQSCFASTSHATCAFLFVMHHLVESRRPVLRSLSKVEGATVCKFQAQVEEVLFAISWPSVFTNVDVLT